MRIRTNELRKMQYRYYTDAAYRESILLRRRAEYTANPEKKNAATQKWRKENPEKCALYKMNAAGAKRLFSGAKARARRLGYAFNIELKDILIPTHCPVLGIAMFSGIGHHGPHSPTLDRIIPDLGS